MIYRELKPSEYGLLKTFLYEAIFIPEGVEPPDRSIIELPELSLYYEAFGSKADDFCIVAEDEGDVVGAVWTRIMDDYGHIDDHTPSLAISVLREYRVRMRCLLYGFFFSSNANARGKAAQIVKVRESIKKLLDITEYI